MIIRFIRLTLHQQLHLSQTSFSASEKTVSLSVILPFHLKSHYQDFKSMRTDQKFFPSVAFFLSSNW